MKEFIAGTAMLLILLIFPLQAQVDTINAFKINNMNAVVYNSAEQARFDGYFTPDNIDKLKTELAAVFSVDPSEVVFEGTTTVKYRSTIYDEREKIEYKITVPFGTLIASADLLDIEQDVNEKTMTKSGFVFSEVLRP